ncbi:microsomal glutathione S-transferase 1-like [Wyeomyia smithii]|uniref:microsomal glutathione S-transferase 1-like n=1 Tax=Wyeomyia smithii TaxID=174621 RepID=UPI002467D84A|nr:microsomal glutathione S-transferase 1-like [Wyeomyia smithii]
MASIFDDVDPTVFRTYAFWASVLVLKVLAMALLTARQRFAKKAFANPEDTKGLPGSKVNLADPDVERVRRAHLNDLENILPYLAIGFLYMLTNPPVFLACNLFRVVAIARIVHTLVYAVFVIPQPARGLSWAAGYFITGYMAVHTMLKFL